MEDKDLIEITNIRQLKIGDLICCKPGFFPMYVVGLFADSNTLGFDSEDRTGIIYADFVDNQGDVFEYNLLVDEIFKIDGTTQKEDIN